MLRPVALQQVFFTLFVLGRAAVMAESECPAECSCDPLPPLCLPGVSWVTDHCGCCKLCARQLNEACSATEPCDHIKGLRCHLGAGGDPERGLCQAEAYGLPCAFNGQVYQHGEDFQPNCQHHCTCMNGVVGCMPLCPYQVPLPQWRCSHSRLVQAEGSCCEEWVCDNVNSISEEPGNPTHTSLSERWPHSNHISPLLPAQLQNHLPATSGGDTFRNKEMESFPLSEVLQESRCLPQTTEWTQCSTTCGMGISSRVTNNNPECQLVRETRLCQIQHCELQLPKNNKEKKCQRTFRPHKPISITFSGCFTARRYRPRTCGACTDGRCCAPSVSRTVQLHFHCPSGDTFYNVMWIQRCSCSTSCGKDTDHSSSLVSLYNDIHTFRD
ncbi:cellular communication network factor 1, like 2 [Archocentrus centrarchus]|uniref:cellular communication network factor 1, like 2 n=1 Tax=Archocentrus centrarchus TaxID=63155 RepID=UPI0011EA4BCA|nr:CCN family member 1-like [Archocentrus centrarchus]